MDTFSEEIYDEPKLVFCYELENLKRSLRNEPLSWAENKIELMADKRKYLIELNSLKRVVC